MTIAVGRFAHIVIDCHDPARLASFWSQVLGVDVDYEWHQYVILKAGGPGHPPLAFQKVPEAKAGKNRVHLDIAVDDLDAARARVEALGGTFVVEHGQDSVTVRVMADPEGNELCLVRVPPA
jgi:predicted enzyme related to lactoylglutathione lyase